MRTRHRLTETADGVGFVRHCHLRAELRGVQEMLRHRGHGARAALGCAGEPAHSVSDEQQESARLRLLRANAVAETRRVDVERAVQACHKEVIGVCAPYEPWMRESEHIHLGECRTLERGLVANRGLHGRSPVG